MSSVARVTTITVRSETSFEDAVATGIARAAQTLRHVSGAWVKEQKVEASEGKITAWSVTLEVELRCSSDRSGARWDDERWGWMRTPRVRTAFARARARLDRRPATWSSRRAHPVRWLAVNLVAGASRVPAPRYAAVVSVAALAWAAYQALIGALVARVLRGGPAVVVALRLPVVVRARHPLAPSSPAPGRAETGGPTRGESTAGTRPSPWRSRPRPDSRGFSAPAPLSRLFALVVGDAFLVVLPSETAVVALGALWATTGAPPLLAIVPAAAAGAVVGDGLCYLIGRRIGLDRWRWQREGRIAVAVARVRDTVQRRTAVLVFTARYVPFARIAVNLAAGAGRCPCVGTCRSRSRPAPRGPATTSRSGRWSAARSRTARCSRSRSPSRSPSCWGSPSTEPRGARRPSDAEPR